MRATTSLSSLDYPLLFTRPHGARTRWLARITLGLAVALTAAVAGLIWIQQPSGLDPSPLKWAVCALGVGLAWIAAFSAFRHARRSVVRMQLWPRSHLVVIHTPGIWSPIVSLVPTKEFGDPARAGTVLHNPFLPSSHDGRAVRVRLNSGASLFFDPSHGEFPCGRDALVAFLHERAYPLAAEAPSLPPGGSARGGDRREPAGPKFPVDRVVGALETVNLETARLNLFESVVERRQQQRVGKLNV